MRLGGKREGAAKKEKVGHGEFSSHSFLNTTWEIKNDGPSDNKGHYREPHGLRENAPYFFRHPFSHSYTCRHILCVTLCIIITQAHTHTMKGIAVWIRVYTEGVACRNQSTKCIGLNVSHSFSRTRCSKKKKKRTTPSPPYFTTPAAICNKRKWCCQCKRWVGAASAKMIESQSAIFSIQMGLVECSLDE